MSLFEQLPTQVSIARQIEAVEREIRFREYVYPKRVAAGKMKIAKAHEEVGFMRAVLATLRRVEKLETALSAAREFVELEAETRGEVDALYWPRAASVLQTIDEARRGTP